MKTIFHSFQFKINDPKEIHKSYLFYVLKKYLISVCFYFEKLNFKKKTNISKYVFIGTFLLSAFAYPQTPFEKYWLNTGPSVDIQPLLTGGYIGIVNFHTEEKFWLYKLDKNGDTLWTRLFKSNEDINTRWAIKVAVASDAGYFILCGNSKRSYSCLFNTILKTNNQGDSLWQVTISDTNLWAGAGYKDLIAISTDNSCVAVGYGSAGGDPRIIKINSEGKVEWKTIIKAFIYTYFSSICQSSDGGYIVTGRNHNNVTGLTNLLVAKFNNEGENLWYKTYYSGLFDNGDKMLSTGYSVAPTNNGGCMIAGYVTEPGIWGSNALVMKLDNLGDSIWTKKYFNPANEFQQNVAYKIMKLPTDEYLVYVKREDGYTSSIGTILKIDPQGDTLWSQVGYDYRVLPNNIDSDGGILFTGYGGGLLADVAVFIRTTKGGVYQSPNLFLPINNSTNVDLNSNLIWTNKHFVDSFNLQIATDSLFANILINEMDIKKDTFQITQLEPFTKYFWRVRSIDKESSNSLWSQVWNFYTSNIVSINELPLPNKFELKQNHPNPFNPTTKIKYSIPKEEKRQMSNLKLVVFDILGREVKTLVNENKKPGNYEIVFDASNLSSGVYFYSLQSDEFIETKMMLLIK